MKTKTQVTRKRNPGSSLYTGKVLVFLLLSASSLLFSKTTGTDLCSIGSVTIIDETQIPNETIYVTENALVYNFSDKTNFSVTEITKQDVPEQKSTPNAKKENKVESSTPPKSGKKQSVPKRNFHSEVHAQESDSFRGLENVTSSAVAGITFHIKFISTINEVHQYPGILCFSKLKINNFVLTRNSKNVHRLFPIRPPPCYFV